MVPHRRRGNKWYIQCGPQVRSGRGDEISAHAAFWLLVGVWGRVGLSSWLSKCPKKGLGTSLWCIGLGKLEDWGVPTGGGSSLGRRVRRILWIGSRVFLPLHIEASLPRGSAVGEMDVSTLEARLHYPRLLTAAPTARPTLVRAV